MLKCSPSINWNKVVSGVVKLLTGSPLNFRRYVNSMLSEKRKNPTDVMIYYYVHMYRSFSELKKMSPTVKFFSPEIQRRLVAIDKKISSRPI